MAIQFNLIPCIITFDLENEGVEEEIKRNNNQRFTQIEESKQDLLENLNDSMDSNMNRNKVNTTLFNHWNLKFIKSKWAPDKF